MSRRSIAFVALFSGFLCTACGSAQDVAKRRLVAADSSMQRIAIIDEAGNTEWERRIGPLHDLQILENGNLLMQDSWTHVIEVDCATHETVWQYDASAAPGNRDQAIEIHAFQRLADGNTLIAESGSGRIVEISPSGEIAKQIRLKLDNPHPHRDTRLVRKLDNGHYLVCHEGDGAVREYDGSGSVVWEYPVPLFDREPQPGHGVESFGNMVFSALRLPNGNTLIGTGNGHSVLEVTPDREIVWSLKQNDLGGIQLAWVTTLQVLPSGNIVIGNCHAGPDNPQLIEVNRDREVVWQFRDFSRFGDSLTNSQILSVDGTAIDAAPLR